ncbi:MAG: hypothetical protein ACKPKO_24275, partial [Candidatus Fonsibacter sp.]
IALGLVAGNLQKNSDCIDAIMMRLGAIHDEVKQQLGEFARRIDGFVVPTVDVQMKKNAEVISLAQPGGSGVRSRRRPSSIEVCDEDSCCDVSLVHLDQQFAKSSGYPYFAWHRVEADNPHDQQWSVDQQRAPAERE